MSCIPSQQVYLSMSIWSVITMCRCCCEWIVHVVCIVCTCLSMAVGLSKLCQCSSVNMAHFQCWELYQHTAVLYGNNDLLVVQSVYTYTGLSRCWKATCREMTDTFMSSVLGFYFIFVFKGGDMSNAVFLVDVLKVPNLSELTLSILCYITIGYETYCKLWNFRAEKFLWVKF